LSERDRSKDKNGGKKKSGRGWALRVFVLAVVLSALLSFFSTTALEGTGYVVAALVLALYWGATLLYLPATILTILAFGFWLPVTIALMIVYPGLEKVFKLEETINARRAAEIEERMAQNQPKFDQ
jgi:hypothetical protein